MCFLRYSFVLGEILSAPSENMRSNGGIEEAPITFTWLFYGNKWIKKYRRLSLLTGQSAGSNMLNTRCINTVCGSAWLEQFVKFHKDATRTLIHEKPSQKTFSFDDGEGITSMKRKKFPCIRGCTWANIVNDVVPNKLTLLLSKTSMKWARRCTISENASVDISGKRNLIQCITSGPQTLFTWLDAGTLPSEVYSCSEQNRSKMALKFHKHFGHPNHEKLLEWGKDVNISDCKLEVSCTEVTEKYELRFQ